jgi:hypothetical protein
LSTAVHNQVVDLQNDATIVAIGDKCGVTGVHIAWTLLHDGNCEEISKGCNCYARYNYVGKVSHFIGCTLLFFEYYFAILNQARPLSTPVVPRTYTAAFVWRLRLLLRSMRLAFTFVPLFLFYPVMCWNRQTMELWWTTMLLLSIISLLCVMHYVTVERSGPTIIKLAQWAATRRDLFSIEFCLRLSRLQRRTRSRPFALTESILCETFGDDWRTLFRRFYIDPIGSGCIAQVTFVHLIGHNINCRYSKRKSIQQSLSVAHVQ